MEVHSENPLVAAILGDVRATKSVICSVFAFLEAVEEDIERHEAASPLRLVQSRVVKSNGIKSQGRRAAQHIARFGLPTENVFGDKSGRKTPQAPVIIPRLVDYLETQGFDAAARSEKVHLLHAISAPFQAKLGLSLGPIRITPAGKSAAAVVEEILKQADERGVVSAIAELIVGSKLETCLGERRRSEVARQHKWENGHDNPSALGDYRIENVAIEVTMVRGPDESHRAKANTITADGTDECWLVVRSDKIKAWQDYLSKAPSKYPGLVRCIGISEFVGLNVTETRWRSTVPSNPLGDVIAKLNELVERLGSQYLPAARVDLVA
ncbi:MAG: hypothetical protein IT449_11255 [Phycisphaerales bacterium]|nr:hypothetical protein [Phycisphaerales bacterium]